MPGLIVDDAAATTLLAASLAPYLTAGDTVGLAGGLGAGKSHLARSLILARLAALGRSEEVPSPTYTLVQTYDLGEVELWHADLYRLGDTDEIAELGLEDAFSSAICLVEWADRLGSSIPDRHLNIEIEFVPDSDDMRRITLVPVGAGWDWLGSATRNIEGVLPA